MNDGYLGKSLTECGPVAVRSMTMREKLESRKVNLEEQLKLINGALVALDANPEIDKALDAISNVGHLI